MASGHGVDGRGCRPVLLRLPYLPW